MGKAIKIIVLILILVGLVVGYFITREEGKQQPRAGGQPELKGDEPMVPVEEKYGFTTEDVGGE
jgi:hypothetical protein